MTDYTYDPNGHLLTTTLENYTGSPAGSQPAAPLIEDSRAYDPAGRLASVTDAMGRVTSYAYTDDGLTATITRSGPGGGSYVQEADTYDPAGNLITKVTNNGATTTNYAVDAGQPGHQPDRRPVRPEPGHRLHLRPRRPRRHPGRVPGQRILRSSPPPTPTT